MKTHTKIYMKYFGFTQADTILCEECCDSAVDIHHIDPKGMGGRNGADVIENLMALCRFHHEHAHGWIRPKFSKERLKRTHERYMAIFKL